VIKRFKPQTGNINPSPAMQIDWPGIKTAAIAVGIREAARQAAADLPPIEANRFVERAMKRCSREKWLVRQQHLTPPQQQVRAVRTGSDSLAGALSRRKDKSAMHLSRYVVDASKRAAASKGELKLAQDVRHVAGVRSHLWPEERQEQASVMVNVAILGVDPQSVRVRGNGAVDV
jgi:hypothetical protein